MKKRVDLGEMRHGTELLKRGFAKMQEGGVVMDVVTAEEAHVCLLYTSPSPRDS